MNRLIGGLLAAFLMSSSGFAQGSDGVLVSPQAEQNNDRGSSTLDSSSTTTTTINSQANSNKDINTQNEQKPEIPPQSAINACQGKSEGEVCQVETRHGLKQGTCSNTEDKLYFFCKPNSGVQKRVNEQNEKHQELQVKAEFSTQ